MEKLVLRYVERGRNVTTVLDDDGLSKDLYDGISPYSNEQVESFIAKTDEILRDPRYLITDYRDMLSKFYADRRLRISKLYENFIVGDYLVVIRTVLRTQSRLFLVYKFENDAIKNVMITLLGNRSHIKTVSSKMNHYNWIATTEAIEVMFAAAMLDNDGVIKFEKHQKRKKNGKVRIYYAPNEAIKKPLQKLNTVLQRAYDKKNADFQVAYKKGKSVYDNAVIHKDKKYVFNIDLKDFYPSCKRDIVRKYLTFLFRSTPLRDNAIDAFLDIITIDDGLFIGNPISGCLANTVLNGPVLYMRNMCKQHDMGFSVYADDMSFSSDRFISEKYVKEMFAEAFTVYGLDGYFHLNEEKSIGYTGCNRKVTGVSINNDNKVTVSRKYYRTLRTMIDHLAKGDLAVGNIRKLQGKLAYATMIDDSGKIYRYLMKFEPTVRKYKLCSDEKLNAMKERFEGRV